MDRSTGNWRPVVVWLSSILSVWAYVCVCKGLPVSAAASGPVLLPCWAPSPPSSPLPPSPGAGQAPAALVSRCPAAAAENTSTDAETHVQYACTILHRCTLLCSKKNKRCSKTINLIIILNLGDISVNKCTGEAAKRQPPIGGGGHRLLLSLSLLTDFYFVPLLLKLRVFHK